jgi:hypothetical protein
LPESTAVSLRPSPPPGPRRRRHLGLPRRGPWPPPEFRHRALDLSVTDWSMLTAGRSPPSGALQPRASTSPPVTAAWSSLTATRGRRPELPRARLDLLAAAWRSLTVGCGHRPELPRRRLELHAVAWSSPAAWSFPGGHPKLLLLRLRAPPPTMDARKSTSPAP